MEYREPAWGSNLRNGYATPLNSSTILQMASGSGCHLQLLLWRTMAAMHTNATTNASARSEGCALKHALRNIAICNVMHDAPVRALPGGPPIRLPEICRPSSYDLQHVAEHGVEVLGVELRNVDDMR